MYEKAKSVGYSTAIRPGTLGEHAELRVLGPPKESGHMRNRVALVGRLTIVDRIDRGLVVCWQEHMLVAIVAAGRRQAGRWQSTGRRSRLLLHASCYVLNELDELISDPRHVTFSADWSKFLGHVDSAWLHVSSDDLAPGAWRSRHDCRSSVELQRDDQLRHMIGLDRAVSS